MFDNFVLNGSAMNKESGKVTTLPRIRIAKEAKSTSDLLERRSSKELSIRRTQSGTPPESTSRSSGGIESVVVSSKSCRAENEVASAKQQLSGIALTKCTRAKEWSPEIENIFRFQQAGFKTSDEYVLMHGQPEYWPESGFVRCLQASKTGYFLYFRPQRECLNNYINKVKIYS
jgi:hypothetical protein